MIERMNNKKMKKEIENLKNIDNISDILQKATEILGNPIVLIDTSYNLLDYTKNVITDDWLWNELVSTGTFSQETVNFFNTANFIADFAKSEIITQMNSPLLKYNRINGKLFDKDNVQVGNICVVACYKDFKNEDFECIEYLCKILSVKLQKSDLRLKIDKVYSHSILDDIINEKKIKQQEIATLYENLKSNLYVAVVDINNYDKTNTHLAYFRDILKKIQPNFKYFIYLNHIVIILSTDKKYLNLKHDLKDFNKIFKENNIFCGISSKFYDLKHIKKQHTEAINALNIGLKSKNKNNIFFYDNFAIEHFLNTSNSTNNIELCHPLIQEIIEFDKENNTELLNFLYTYLINLSNIKTKNDLNITEKHYRKAVKQLKSIFEINLKDIDLCLSLYLSIKMLEIFK